MGYFYRIILELTMYRKRKNILKDWEKRKESKCLLYVTGDRPGWETQISSETLDYLISHLDKIGDTSKISLFLYTRGGNTLAAWSIVNLLKQFCKQLEIIIPSKAQSAGTLICLGADEIIMTKQATLGPIDPSVNGPFNPTVGNIGNVPVSVEALNGFIDFAKKEAKLNDSDHLKTVFLKLAELVHPVVLGNAYRARGQIRMLAKRLLANQIRDENQIKKILDFLCSDTGSHDYTINRNEAKDDLGLNVKKPNDDEYKEIKNLYDDFAKELRLGEPYSPEVELGTTNDIDYKNKRVLLESVEGGSHFFVSEGKLTRGSVPSQTPSVPQFFIQDKRTLEGWKHEK